MTTYTALRGIAAPGTSVFGYHRGHPVSEAVVENWGLVVGEANDPDADVVEGDIPETVASSPAPARPGPDANRAAWESYALANGMSPEDVAAASQEDLESVGGTQQGNRPDRPADSAPKADWIAYAVALGADEQWAHDSTTTKANLQAYEPAVGDTVAVAATEANQA